jgi:hypothetical protein
MEVKLRGSRKEVFSQLSPGDTFRVFNECFCIKTTNIKKDDVLYSNAVRLTNGSHMIFSANQEVEPLRGAFVEE